MDKLNDLNKKSRLVRRSVLTMLHQAGSGHSAGSLDMTDIFTYLYFGGGLKHRPKHPHWGERDYLILSNGHICPVWYATLAEAGYFDQELLSTLRQIDSPLQGHPHYGSLPGVENTSGPLGQGLSQALGVALALRIDHKPNRVFCLMSDGEHQEGQTWEAYMFAAKEKLKNVTAIIDRNEIQIGGYTKEIMPLKSLRIKIKSFNWSVVEIDGHDFDQIGRALLLAKSSTQPTAIICRTIAGKGVSFMENRPEWHGRVPNDQEYQLAMEELS